MNKRLFSIYLHIPYCDSKCPYCDFNSYAVKEWPEDRYTAALIAEMRAAAREPVWKDRPVHTLFLGGGTPSLFSPSSIERVLAAVSELWPTEADIEITMEANPGTVDAGRLAAFRASGVNRISFGVQSFHEHHLKRLGRIHGARQAMRAIEEARAGGFSNVNLDLIFAVPGQTLTEWEEDLSTAVALGTDHVSAYNLTFEEGTPFEAMRRKGALQPLSEEIEVAMFTRGREILGTAGYAQYEISNYARSGRQCRHNLNYWQGGDYLGVGAGAHSFSQVPFPGARWSNAKLPSVYVERIEASGRAKATEESLTVRQAQGEFIFLHLRLREGFEAGSFQDRFGTSFTEAFPHAESFEREGLLEHHEQRWRLTERGLLLADSVFATFL